MMDADTAASNSLYFNSLCSTTNLFVGLISDICLGRYSTIKIFLTVYLLGEIFLCISVKWVSTPISLVALLLIGVGKGGIGPCLSTFGADQFLVYPSEKRKIHTERFFMIIYFIINVGCMFSYLVVPIIRERLGYF